MKPEQDNIVEKTELLSLTELETLVDESTYILGLTIISQLEQDITDFEGIDTWIFDQYRIQIDQQFLPIQDTISWTNTTLSMPGVKQTAKSFGRLDIGGRYIAFYVLSAMADGYYLKGLMHWNDEKVSTIEDIIQLK